MGTSTRTRTRRLMAGSLFTAVALVASVAFAEWLASGTGTGRAKAATAAALTVSPAEPTTLLTPGGTGDVAFTITNPNAFPVTTRWVEVIGPITSDKAGCDATTSQVSFANQDGEWVVPASGSLPVELAGAVAMGADAPDACQGATFSIPLRVRSEAPPPIVAVGYTTDILHGAAFASTDGMAWTPHTEGFNRGMWSLATNGDVWVAGSSGRVYTSPDGLAWTERLVGAQSHGAVSWGNGTFMTGSYAGVYLSADGASWSPTNVGPTGNTITGVAWSDEDGLWAVVSTAGLVFSSPTGAYMSWTQRYFNSGGLYGLASDGSQFVGVGGLGRVLTSPDGITWTLSFASTTSTLNEVATNGSIWVAVGEHGTVVTSPDGASWTVQVSGTTQHLNGVAWTGSSWVAVGDSGVVVRSSDGGQWAAGSVGVDATLEAVAVAP